MIEQLRAARPRGAFLELVHRLDRDTSGVLLVAKKRAALTSRCTRSCATARSTSATCAGARPLARREARACACRCTSTSTRDGERRVRVETPTGRTRETVFRRVRAWPARDPPLALLEAELKTGRTHQIRVHLAHLGFPLAGDDKYGDFEWNRQLAKQGLKRMFLHAATLALRASVDRRAGGARSAAAARPRALSSPRSIQPTA